MFRNLTFYFISFFIMVSVASVEAGSIAPELQPLLFNLRNTGNVDVIIEFKNVTGIPDILSMKRKNIIQTLKNKNITSQINTKLLLEKNHIKPRNLWIKNAIAASIPTRLIPIIASQNQVSLIRLDKKISLETNVQGAPPSELYWNLSIIETFKARNHFGVRGEGIVIGSMDTGVDINHPALLHKWRGGNNSWFDPYGVYTTPYDNNGHGTQTTSTIVGSSYYHLGVAPSAKWIAAKIFDDTDTASISAIHQAFQWMLDPDEDPDTDDGADIVNNSWNFGTIAGQCDYEFQDDISILRAADIAVVFSAGNSGPSPATSHSPANNKDTIPVGAIDELQNVAFFSSRGPSACDDGSYPKLLAPGVNILTADLTFGGIFPDSYTYSSGTSYAGPHISGALALLQSKFPSSSLSDRENALYETAMLINSESENRIINIYAAMLHMNRAKLLSPSSYLGTITNPLYSWHAVIDTNQYKLIVVDTDSHTRVIDQLYTTDEVGCSTNSSCSIIHPTSLPDGRYLWRIRTKNDHGWGAWSNAMSFIIGEPPSSVILNTPSVNMSNDSFNWTAIPNATYYKLMVFDKNLQTRTIDQLYTATELGCSTDSSCSITIPTSLSNGRYLWQVRTKNASGWGAWSNSISFFIGTPPMKSTLNDPLGNISGNIPFSWNAVSNTSHYKLIVLNKDSNVFAIKQTYTASEAGCSTNTSCSVLLQDPLADGHYLWRIRTKNISGWGPWSVVNHFTRSN